MVKNIYKFFNHQHFKIRFDSFKRLSKNLKIYNHTKTKHFFDITVTFLIYRHLYIRSLRPIKNKYKTFYDKCQSIQKTNETFIIFISRFFGILLILLSDQQKI